MPPRCPTPSLVRRAAEVTICRSEQDDIDRDCSCEKREQQRPQQHQQPGCCRRAAAPPPPLPPPPLPTCDSVLSCSGMSAGEAAGSGGSEGEPPGGDGGYGFPLLFTRLVAPEAEVTLQDDETSSETSSSSSSGSSAVSCGAMMALSARDGDEGEEDDLGTLVPALHRDGVESVTRESRHDLPPPACSSVHRIRQPFFRSFITEASKTLSAATATTSGRNSQGTPPRRIGHHFRALSSQCLEGLDWGDSDGGGVAGGRRHHRRERSESEPQLLLGMYTSIISCDM